METRKIVILMTLLLCFAAEGFAQKWYLIGYDKNGNIRTNGGVPAVIDIKQDLLCLQSSLGNSADYFAIMRKNGNGVWFNDVYKATFELRNTTTTDLESLSNERFDVSVADNHVVLNGCIPGMEIRIVHADGRLALRRKAESERLMIDMSRLSQGIYLLHTPSRTVKFVKKHPGSSSR